MLGRIKPEKEIATDSAVSHFSPVPDGAMATWVGQGCMVPSRVANEGNYSLTRAALRRASRPGSGLEAAGVAEVMAEATNAGVCGEEEEESEGGGELKGG